MLPSRLHRLGRFLLRYLFAIACCVYAFTVGIPKNRMLVYRVNEWFGWSPPWKDKPAELLPKVSVDSVVSPDCAIKLIEDRDSGNTSLLESVVINKLAVQTKAKNVFEIGTFDGRTALGLAANLGHDARVLTLDLPQSHLHETEFELCQNDKQYVDKSHSGVRFKGTPYEKQIKQLFGDSATYDFSPHFGSVDLVFVDGSHAYEYVQNDSQIALQLIKEGGGTIIWHDYGEWSGVTRALNELYCRHHGFSELKHVAGTTLAILRCPRQNGHAG